eukprot:GHRQ01013636.1.p1 GENE.GHRQ01013636.1~~GHRQ01013636.1.p1  ORF type:complete len:156 (+),score=31.94 GHRQ01013636.1:425-892(+)
MQLLNGSLNQQWQQHSRNQLTNMAAVYCDCHLHFMCQASLAGKLQKLQNKSHALILYKAVISLCRSGHSLAGGSSTTTVEAFKQPLEQRAVVATSSSASSFSAPGSSGNSVVAQRSAGKATRCGRACLQYVNSCINSYRKNSRSNSAVAVTSSSG